MLRPITRRWGICFRSTQRYTVCGLTPRKMAASRTRSGSSSRSKETLVWGGGREFAMSASGEWSLLQLFEQFSADAKEPRFLNQIEFERRVDRFLEGQLTLAHAPDVFAKGIRRSFGNANRSQHLLAIVQEHLHLIERLSI